MAYKSLDKCIPCASDCDSGNNSCEMAFTVVIAEGYTNSSSTSTCNTEPNFGGTFCDPSAWSISIFEKLNDFRANALITYKPLLASLLEKFKVEDTAEDDWNGDGTETSRNFVSARGNVENAMN